MLNVGCTLTDLVRFSYNNIPTENENNLILLCLSRRIRIVCTPLIIHKISIYFQTTLKEMEGRYKNIRKIIHMQCQKFNDIKLCNKGLCFLYFRLMIKSP